MAMTIQDITSRVNDLVVEFLSDKYIKDAGFKKMVDHYVTVKNEQKREKELAELFDMIVDARLFNLDGILGKGFVEILQPLIDFKSIVKAWIEAESEQ